MELGTRLKQARLDAGLSQRQLCGDVITRNMLSQIENGSARPSMDTLRYLAAQLGKPISFFLEEEAQLPHNQQILLQARQERGSSVLEVLEAYQPPDPVFDPERYLLEALTCLDLAERAITEKKHAYALALLEQAQAAGEKTPYYTRELERKRLLLCFRAGQPVSAEALPDWLEEVCLRASAALAAGNPELAGRCLDAGENRDAYWHLLRGEAWEALEDYGKAVEEYLQAEPCSPVYASLERCYKALGDYKNAYEYACRQR